MGRLLMIESWVNATGVVVPQRIREMGHRYTLLTRDSGLYTRYAPSAEGHPVLLNADEVITVETNDFDQLMGRAIELHRIKPFDGVLTTCDYYLATVAAVARRLGLPGVSPESMRVATRKDLVREACRRAGLPGPAFGAVRSLEEARRFAQENDFPLVVKPVDLCASEGVLLVRTWDELQEAFARAVGDARNSRQQLRAGLVLLEKPIPGEEFCVEAVAGKGRVRILGISGKTLSSPPRFLELGSHVPADLPTEERRALDSFVSATLVAIGYTHGLAHVEVRRTPQGFQLIEVNPRLGGDYLFELYAHVSGLDLPGLFIDLALGRDPVDISLAQDRGSAALECLLPPRAGTVRAVEGVEALRSDPRFTRITVKDIVGQELREPIDNTDFIGFVVAVDPQGSRARAWACEARDRLRLVMA